MRQCARLIRPAALLTGTLLVLAFPAPATAGPGDLAADQNRYPVIRSGAKNLHQALNALEKGDDKFKGHRNSAIKHVRHALNELDAAVRYADKNKEPGEKGNNFFEPARGQIAASQNKFPAIRRGAREVIEAGRALGQGDDKFGGHRVNAQKALNQALDELEAAAKNAN